MNTKDLIQLGVPVGEPLALAHEFIQNFIAQGNDGALLEAEISNIVANPPAFFADDLRGPLARSIDEHKRDACATFTPRADLAPWRQWGEGLEAEAVRQMANACALPVAVAGALMPDAHVGYGLPIGGVLATDNAVVPYAVGVDIACRMKLTVYDRKANTIAGQRDRLANIIEDETRFGMGCEFKQRRQHDVMDEDWSVSPVTQRLRDKAWAQLGTSGSGNHFVEFGAFTVTERGAGSLPVDSSGSQAGSQVCSAQKVGMIAGGAARMFLSAVRGVLRALGGLGGAIWAGCARALLFLVAAPGFFNGVFCFAALSRILRW